MIYNQDAEVMERFLFDVERFPVVDAKEQLTDFEAREGAEGPGVSRSDVEEQLRATIRKLSYAGEKLAPLPADCTFTVAVELRDKANPPIGVSHPHNIRVVHQRVISDRNSILNPGYRLSQIFRPKQQGAKPRRVTLAASKAYLSDWWRQGNSF